MDFILQSAAAKLGYRKGDEPEIPPLKDFAQLVKPDLDMDWYIELIIDVLQKVGDGEISRVMVFMPPRHGKSTLVQIFTAWFLLKKRGFSAITASYAAKRAEANSKDTQRFLTAGGGHLFTKKPSEWTTTDGSEMRAVGVGGGVSGFDGHLLLLDDPFSGARDAQSVVMQHRLEDWFFADFMTRATQWPDGEGGTNDEVPVVIIQTLWSEIELSMNILAREKALAADPETRDLCEEWHIVHLPALYTTEPMPEMFPDTCVVYPDPRTEEGEPLAPRRRSAKELRRIHARLKLSGREWMWHSLYQQRPKPPEGTWIKRDWFKPVNADKVPPITRWYRGWDLAFSAPKRKNHKDLGIVETDYTASILAGMGTDRRIYFKLDILEKQKPAEVRQLIEAQPALDPHNTVVCIESAHAGLAIIDEIRDHGELNGVEIEEVKPGSRDKLARALGWINKAARGQMRYVLPADVDLSTLDLDGGHTGREEIDLFLTFLRCAAAFRNQEGDFDDPIDAMSVIDEVLSREHGQQKDPFENDTPTIWEKVAASRYDWEDDEDD